VVDVPAAELETAALAHNPDLAVALYDARIAQLEARKAIVKLFPSVTFDYELHHDTDSYMINNSWNTASARISFDLFRFATLSRDLASIELTEQLAQRKQMAVLMSVVAQVHLARLEYRTALHAYGRADELSQVDGRLRDIAVRQGKEEAQSKLDVVSARTAAIVSLGHRYQAIVQAQAAMGRLQSTLGVDPVAEAALDLPTEQLAQRLDAYLAGWQDGSWLKNLNTQPR
jgi:outer membrane protein TolC